MMREILSEINLTKLCGEILFHSCFFFVQLNKEV